jgi:hypothetical protein
VIPVEHRSRRGPRWTLLALGVIALVCGSAHDAWCQADYPVSPFTVTRGFGVWIENWNGSGASGYHLGQDAVAPAATEIHSMAAGTVKYASTAGGYGSVVIIEHHLGTDTVTAVYGHLSGRRGLEVSVGEAVSMGTLVGTSADDDEDGGGWAPHLHFGIRQGAYSTTSICGFWPYVGYSQACTGTTHDQYLATWLNPSDFIAAHSTCTISPGQGGANAQAFVTAYDRNGGRAGAGCATNAVHRWGSGYTQDFSGGAGGTGAIMLADGVSTAWYVHGAIWTKYAGLGGAGHVLGYPVSDEGTATSSVTGAAAAYSNFQGGAIDHHANGPRAGTTVWIGLGIFQKWSQLSYGSGVLGLPVTDEGNATTSPLGTTGRVAAFENGEITWHGSGSRMNQAFETHGALDAFYVNACGGTGGCLGFPVADQGGASSATFEGGTISWTGTQYQSSCGSHSLTITTPASGTPNPVASAGTASLSVTASDSLGHSLSYSWSASCPTLGSSGSFSSTTVRTPTWTAPANATGSQKSCTIQVVVSDGQGLSQSSSYTQAVAAEASACSGHFICEEFTAAASGWTFNGAASQRAGESLVELTADSTYLAGSAFYGTPVTIASFEASFGVRLDAAGSPVADGMTFAVTEAGPTALGIPGACLGYCGTPGRSFAIEVDTYDSVEHGDPAGVHVGLDVDGSVVSTATASLGPIVNQGLLSVRVVFSSGALDVFLRGGSGYPAEVRVLTASIPGWTPFVGYFGFTGATGGFSARHAVDRLDVELATAAPVLTTNAASSVTGSAATLNATVNPSGSATSVSFDYGLSSASLTQTVSYGSVGSGVSNVGVSQPVSGLSCGTSYFFRARATNAGGTATGDTLAFATSACSSSPALRVIRPNGGETLRAGGTYTIEWAAENLDPAAEVRVWLWDDVSWEPLAAVGPDTTQVSWTVPAATRSPVWLFVGSYAGSSLEASDWADAAMLVSRSAGYYTVSPCRAVDTRQAAAGPLPAGGTRSLAIGGTCGVPLTATAVTVNVTVTQPSTIGHLRLFPTGLPRPASSSLNFAAGQTRANNATLSLGEDGTVSAYLSQAYGTAHVIVDVSGYYE